MGIGWSSITSKGWGQSLLRHWTWILQLKILFTIKVREGSAIYKFADGSEEVSCLFQFCVHYCWPKIRSSWLQMDDPGEFIQRRRTDRPCQVHLAQWSRQRGKQGWHITLLYCSGCWNIDNHHNHYQAIPGNCARRWKALGTVSASILSARDQELANETWRSEIRT